MSSDIQAAIEKARAIASRLASQNPEGGGGGGGGGGFGKRQYESNNVYSSNNLDDGPNKKFASVNDAVGAQLAMLKAQNANGQISDEMKVPDNKVGLVIGKGGEQLHRLQAEVSCKISIGHESNANRERTVTILGTRENIERCKRAIEDIVRSRGPYDRQDGGPNGGGGGGFNRNSNMEIIEIMVPGNKCGLIIGKGGETIKGLSEQYGCKLVVVQDPDTPLNSDKPLRITGEPEKAAKAKEAVLALINGQNNGPNQMYGGRGGTNDYGSSSGGGPGRGGMSSYLAPGMIQSQIRVPFDKAGLVIGKGGEAIKDINKRSGAHVEIDRNHKNSPEGSDRVFMIRGTEDQVAYAQQLVYEKVSGSIGGVPPPGFFGDQAYVPSSTGGGGPSSAANPWAQYGADQTAAWAAYYQQYYAAAGIPTAQPAAVPAPAAAQAPHAPAPGGGGQADYTQAWIDYYRSMGMHDQAEQIAKQSQQPKTTSPSDNGVSPSNGTNGAVAPNGGGLGDNQQQQSADPYASWYQYQNYANYYAQAAAGGNDNSAGNGGAGNGHD